MIGFVEKVREKVLCKRHIYVLKFTGCNETLKSRDTKNGTIPKCDSQHHKHVTIRYGLLIAYAYCSLICSSFVDSLYKYINILSPLWPITSDYRFVTHALCKPETLCNKSK